MPEGGVGRRRGKGMPAKEAKERKRGGTRAGDAEYFWEYVLILPDETRAAEFDSLLRKLNRLGGELGLKFQKLAAGTRPAIRAGASLEGLSRQAEQLVFLKPVAPAYSEDVKAAAVGPESPACRPFIHDARSEYAGWGTRDFFSPSERVILVHSLLYRLEETGKDGVSRSLIPQLLHEERLETLFPPHDRETANSLLKQAMLESEKSDSGSGSDGQRVSLRLARLLFAPVDAIERYYGSSVAFYFAWLDFFTAWALVPAAVGFLLWYFRGEGRTVDDSPRIPLFSVFVIFWSALFLKYWERHACVLACKWGTLDTEKREDVRPQFHGATRISPVTGRKELHFGFQRRAPRYLLSVCVTLVMLAVAVAVMCVFLNLEGYVHKDSPAYIKQAAIYAEPGSVFDPNIEDATLWQSIIGLIPVVSHSLVILMLNNIYRVVAEWLTDLENHRLENEHENSLIIKRFLFEAFDCYIALFYIAFYELDPISLRKELVGLYTVDSMRRIVCECLLPMGIQRLTQCFSGVSRADGYASRKKDDDFQDDPINTRALEDISLDEYEQFDDYLEMVIEFGYITLFASAFPLASALSVLCNFIELKSDMFKLALICQRPHAHRARNIGIWQNIMYTIFYVSIMSNCFLFGFTTEQMMVWIPSWFQIVDEVQWDGSQQKDQAFAAGKGRYVVFMVFALEHLLLLAATLIFAVIPSTPGWVRIDIARRDFEREEAVRKLHLVRVKSRAPSSAAGGILTD